MKIVKILTVLLAVQGCSKLQSVGKAPTFTPADRSAEVQAMQIPALYGAAPVVENRRASLWSGGRGSLLGDRRAGQTGDIMTVVIQIDESAEISNATSRSRNGSEIRVCQSFWVFLKRWTGFFLAMLRLRRQGSSTRHHPVTDKARSDAANPLSFAWPRRLPTFCAMVFLEYRAARKSG